MTYESTDRLLRTDGWMSDARAHRRKQLFFVSGIERISAIILHIGLSLLIYRAVKAGECRTAESDKCRTAAFTAVLAYGIHFIVDFFAVAGSALLPIYVIEIGVFVMAAGTLVMALKMGRMEEL